MDDIAIRIEGRAGRVTLNRPKALNALTWDMLRALDRALIAWATDPGVRVVVIDAVGDKAFCAGGDIAEMYRTGKAGDYEYGRRFWREEYAMNARLAAYPKPVVALMQGFTMGGGVGLACHASHRVVDAGSQVAMPECGIGFVPDVGGSALLARAPGALGAYLGLTAARMGPGDAIYAGFADHFIPRESWPMVIDALVADGQPAAIEALTVPPPPAPLAEAAEAIDTLFAETDHAALLDGLARADSPLAAEARAGMARTAPLSQAVTLAMLARLRDDPPITVPGALRQEYRVAHRIMERGDFIEGIRAAIIDKDRNPRWRHADAPVPQAAVDAMLAPLGDAELRLEEG